MTRHDIDKQISQCVAENEQTQRLLRALREIDPATGFEEYKAHLLASSLQIEATAVKVRHLAANTAFGDRQRYYQDIAQTQGITITNEHGWVKIVMPFLLPNRRAQKYNCDFLTDPLDHALAAFVKELPVRKYDNCILAFRYIYSVEYPIRDHDNIETKKVIDVITSHLLPDDSGKYCAHFYTSARGAEVATEIYVMDKNRLKYWLELV